MQVSLHALGDEAILVQFENKIDPEINEHVIRLGVHVERVFEDAVKYVVPAYCSLTIVYDKAKTDPTSLEKEVIKGLDITDEEGFSKRTLFVPVCYDKKFATDLEEICNQTKLTSTEVVRMHSSHMYRTYMIGFLPGFPYLGQLPEELICERKSIPEMKVPTGAVAIAGKQTGIYPSESPGGWQVIGRTPLPLVNALDDNPFLFHQGDRVQFYSISISQFNNIQKSLTKGEFDWETVYE